MRSRLWSVGAISGIALVVACARGAQPTAGVAAEWLDLTGTWVIEFVPAGGQPGGMSSDSRRIQLRRIPRDSVRRVASLVAALEPGRSFVGQYDRDYPTPRATEGSTEREVVAVASAGDSVTVAFNPAINHGGVNLDGRLTEGRIVGRWYLRGPSGSSGSFVMSRTSPP